MAPKKSVSVKYYKVFLQTFGVAFILWLIPLLQGKYADIQYSYISADDITKELLTIKKISQIHHSNPVRKFPFRRKKEDANSEQLEIKKRLTKEARKEEERRSVLPECPRVSPLLKGLQWAQEQDDTGFREWNRKEHEKFAAQNSIQSGGFWQPTTCRPQYAVTVIIGQRNRTEELQRLLLYLHPFLMRQQLRYRIIVVDQDNNEAYNRGKIFNIGYAESQLLSPPGPEQHCIVLHDVDLLPLNDHNIYTCIGMPRHMSVLVNTLRYQLLYQDQAGGAIAMQSKQFEDINGFSNLFAGWGGEDDDFNIRIRKLKLHTERFEGSVCMYDMMQHSPAVKSNLRYQFQQENWQQLSADDGLSSLQYRHSKPPDRHPLMMRYTVDW